MIDSLVLTFCFPAVPWSSSRLPRGDWLLVADSLSPLPGFPASCASVLRWLTLSYAVPDSDVWGDWLGWLTLSLLQFSPLKSMKTAISLQCKPSHLQTQTWDGNRHSVDVNPFFEQQNIYSEGSLHIEIYERVWCKNTSYCTIGRLTPQPEFTDLTCIQGKSSWLRGIPLFSAFLGRLIVSPCLVGI